MKSFIVFLALVTMVSSMEVCKLPKGYSCMDVGDDFYDKKIKKTVYCFHCEDEFDTSVKKRIICGNETVKHSDVVKNVDIECEPITESPTMSPTFQPTTAPTNKPWIDRFREECEASYPECESLRWHPKQGQFSTRGKKICKKQKGECKVTKLGKKIASNLD